MALKIIKASDAIRIERIIACIYGPPGIGKTSIAFTAERPLLLDFDLGAHRACNRKDSVRIASWDQVADLTADDLAPYKTVIVDTVGRALDVLTADIIRLNAKNGKGGGQLSLQGFGVLKGRFADWLKSLLALGMDVVLIAHMDEQRSGDDIIERLDVQGSSKGEVYKQADAMGRLAIRDGKRILDFSPTAAAFGKNPGQLDPVHVPHPEKMPDFLATVIDSIKDRLNTLTAEQAAAQALIESWAAKIAGFKTLPDFNRALPDVKAQPQAVKALFSAAAKGAGHVFDKAAGEYVSGEPAAEPAVEPAAEAA